MLEYDNDRAERERESSGETLDPIQRFFAVESGQEGAKKTSAAKKKPLIEEL